MTASDQGFRGRIGTEPGAPCFLTAVVQRRAAGTNPYSHRRQRHGVSPSPWAPAYLLQAPEMGDQLSAEMCSIHLPLRLSALMDLYIHPLYVLVSKILFSILNILNSPAPIHPLYHPLSTISTVGPTCHFI
jgi:hypothetical protein